ncbi:N-acetylmuramic acid 6-phosphate etherase [Babesia caballi]|uniref:N-acetylmuramic acid 6-phosphate etherase n=1 Tax=Babesia caballi TaxID=5871 RepID=A0AAV4M1Z9_BABCB|nr:N-acetylmuramic acid 6-phosphate etherase [Babesia caballi]
MAENISSRRSLLVDHLNDRQHAVAVAALDGHPRNVPDLDPRARVELGLKSRVLAGVLNDNDLAIGNAGARTTPTQRHDHLGPVVGGDGPELVVRPVHDIDGATLSLDQLARVRRERHDAGLDAEPVREEGVHQRQQPVGLVSRGVQLPPADGVRNALPPNVTDLQGEGDRALVPDVAYAVEREPPLRSGLHAPVVRAHLAERSGRVRGQVLRGEAVPEGEGIDRAERLRGGGPRGHRGRVGVLPRLADQLRHGRRDAVVHLVVVPSHARLRAVCDSRHSPYQLLGVHQRADEEVAQLDLGVLVGPPVVYGAVRAAVDAHERPVDEGVVIGAAGRLGQVLFVEHAVLSDAVHHPVARLLVRVADFDELRSQVRLERLERHQNALDGQALRHDCV